MIKKACVKGVSKSSTHSFSKHSESSIQLIKGLGVEGDAHQGKKVKHRSRVAKDPNQPNLRQVHLIHSELHQELSTKGFTIKSGEMGENITTEGIDLLALPQDTILTIGESSKVQIKGLRNPCHQLNGLADGLMKAVLDHDDQGNIIRKAGIMGIVLEGGEVKVGDSISIELPEKPFKNLEPV